MTETSPLANSIYQIASLPANSSPDAHLLIANSNGLFKGGDQAAAWQPALDSLQLAESIPVLSLAVSPSFLADRTIFAGMPGGAVRSVDGGATWRVLTFPPPPPTVTCVAYSPNYLKDGTVLAGTAEDGVLISTNGGDAWQPWNFGLIDPEVLCLAVSPAFEEDETLFCGTASGLFRSTNAGRAWREVELPAGLVPVLSLAVSPLFPTNQQVYAGSEENGLFFSADGGDAWARIGADTLTDPINSILLGDANTAPDLLLVLHSEEILFSSDRGKSWRNLRPAGASAVHAPHGLASGLPLVLGLNTGQIVTVEIPK